MNDPLRDRNIFIKNINVKKILRFFGKIFLLKKFFNNFFQFTTRNCFTHRRGAEYNFETENKEEETLRVLEEKKRQLEEVFNDELKNERNFDRENKKLHNIIRDQNVNFFF